MGSRTIAPEAWPRRAGPEARRLRREHFRKSGWRFSVRSHRKPLSKRTPRGQKQEAGNEGQRMRRRDFITLLAAAGAAPALAQAPTKVRRIGIVVEGMRSPAYDGFLQGMSELGYM